MNLFFFLRTASIFLVTSILAGFLFSCDDDDEAPEPQVTAINPSSAMPNTLVSITGNSFSAVFSENKVSFNGKEALVSNASATQLNVMVPAGAQTGPVTVTVNGREATNKPVFTVESIPSVITNVSPLSGKYNSTVTITGSNFRSTPSENVVTINGVPAVVESATATTLSVKVPARAGSGAVIVNGVTAVSRFTYDPDIYIVGYMYDESGVSRATYWKNGVPTKVTGAGLNTFATSIALNGDDIYVSGNRTLGSLTVARLWKNGGEVPLSDDTRTSYADAVAVVGNDVYVAGYEYLPAGFSAAKYWKNGTPVILSDGTTFASATSIVVDGQDVYVGGNSSLKNGNTVATYWKNGVPKQLTKRVSFSWGINVSGGNVYSTGSIRNTGPGNGFVSSWQNADSVLLGHGIGGGAGRDIVVVGSDVYVAGEEDNAKLIRLAKYWKNGVPVILTTGIVSAGARGIDVLGEDVYVVGWEFTAGGQSIAKLWKNGVPVSLTDGSYASSAEDIVIR